MAFYDTYLHLRLIKRPKIDQKVGFLRLAVRSGPGGPEAVRKWNPNNEFSHTIKNGFYVEN